MVNAPLACTLSTIDLAAVKQRYREAAAHYDASARITGASAVIALTGDRAFLRSLLDEMVTRESECCSFLTFDIAATNAGFEVTLHARVDTDIAPQVLRESVGTLFPAAETGSVG